ncbi:MAG TPA: choice-of-anchor D domain-containing protein [Prosthecobacter sp.]|nr:choice-of-anchor D domain-containing protein [Prosthecobacter sp.]
MTLDETGQVEDHSFWGSEMPWADLGVVTAIAAGAYHSVALNDDGTVVAWGEDNPFENVGQADVPSGLSDVEAIAAGWYHTVALKDDGTVVAWGATDGDVQYAGQTDVDGLTGVKAIAAGGFQTLVLFNNGTVQQYGWGSESPPAGLTGVAAIAIGYRNAAALKTDGTVVVWGDNDHGQKTIPPGLSNVTSIAVGDEHIVALKADGSVVAWGYNFDGQATVPAGIGPAFAIAAGGDFTVALLEDTPPQIFPASRNVTAAGGAFDFSITANAGWTWDKSAGSDWVTSSEAASQNGDQTFSYTVAPNTSTTPRSATITIENAVGYHSSTHTIQQEAAATGSGMVVAWGNNSSGQTNVPAGLNDVTAIAAGNAHTVALKADGTLLSWGLNISGQPAGLNNVIAISAGAEHTVALKSDGTVTAWGFNGSGQTTVPAGLSNVTAIATGWDHNLALKSDGTVVAWGNNSHGQRVVPAGLSGVVAVAAGWKHSVALKSDGTVVAWGYNVDGQTNVPAGLNGVTAIATRGNHTLALKSDGTVVAWGSNSEGQTTVPAGLAGVTTIAAGYNHSLAGKADGTVVAWGGNFYGQTTVPAGLDDVVALAGGAYHSVALVHGTTSAELSVTPTIYNATAAGGNSSFEVTASGTWSWSKSAGADWVTTSESSNQTGNQTFSYTVATNSDTAQRSAVITLTSGALTATHTINQAGTESRVIALSGDLAFGNVTVGQSATRTLTIQNTGNSPMSVSGISYPTGFSGNWSSGSIAAGGSQNVTVTFSPTAAQSYSGNVTVNSNATSGAGVMAISGTGVPGGGDSNVVAWGYNADGQTDVPAGLMDAIAISAGGIHTMALRSNGTVVAWGSNTFGQTNVPAGLTNVTAIAAGGNHSLALKGDGTVVAWGNNSHGQTNVPAGLVNVIAIAASSSSDGTAYHSVALKSDGTVVAWGDNFSGQTNVPAGLANVTAIAAGSVHTMALKSDGTIVVWGPDIEDGPGDVPPGLSGVTAIAAGASHMLALKSDGTVVAWGGWPGSTATQVPAGLSGVVAIAAGGNHSMALKQDGTVVAWGEGMYGQTVPPEGLSGVAAIAAGSNHSVALIGENTSPNLSLTPSFQIFAATGSVFEFAVTASGNWTWSKSGASDWVTTSEGTSQNGNQTFSYMVTANPGTLPRTVVITLTSGMLTASHTIHQMGASTVGGQVIAWGSNGGGQTNVPPGMNDVISVSAGNFHTVALRVGGTVAAWGGNSFGETQVPAGLANVIAIAAGSFHTVALKSDGTVVAWGRNTDGQCSVPAGLNNIVAIAAGSDHTLALKSDGTLVAWGANDYGQSSIPPDTVNIIAIAAGAAHNVYLRSDGLMGVWGNNEEGQVNLPGGTGEVKSIAAGMFHSLAARSNGSVVAWGSNWAGQTIVPAGLGDVVQVAAGAAHSLALREDGTVVAWGYDGDGQATVPPSLGGVFAIATGFYHSVAVTAGDAPTAAISLAGNLSFGNVQTGQTATRVLTIQNTGNASLNVTTISYPIVFLGDWNGGSIPPGGSQSVTVTFSPAAVQSYSGTITVISDAASGVNTIAASGTGIPPNEPPDWQPPVGKENSMTVYAQVENAGVRIDAPGSMLAVFEGGAVAGVASPINGPAGLFYQLTVWSNQAAVSNLPLKVYDAATNEIHDIQERVNFTANGVLGLINAPVIFTVQPPVVEQVVPLVTGWNWISFNALPETPTVTAVLAGYTPQDNDLIKGVAGSATYFGGSWFPASFAIQPGRMYMLRRQQAGAGALNVTGPPADESLMLNLVAGWNWLGYIPQEGRGLGATLDSLTLADNDLVKSQQDGTATFFGGQWFPGTVMMQPGRGYLLRLAQAQSFAYDGTNGALSAPLALEPEASGTASADPGWMAPLGKENSMTVYAAIQMDGAPVTSIGSLLAAFDGAEVAGVAEVMDGPAGKLFQLTIWSDSASKPGLALKVYDAATGAVRDIAEPVDFATNAILGGIATPLAFNAVPVAPSEFEFSSPVFNASGNPGSVDLEIVRVGGASPATVTLTTSDGSAGMVPPFAAAVAGTDYTALNTVVNFAEGEMSKVVPVTLLPRTGKLPNRRLNAALSAPSGGATLGAIASAEVRLLAPDSTKPALAVTLPSASAKTVALPLTFLIFGTVGDALGVDRVVLEYDGDSYSIFPAQGGAANLMALPWSIEFTPKAEGPVSLTFTAYDLAGNSTKVTRSFVYERRQELVVARDVPAALETMPDKAGTVQVKALIAKDAALISKPNPGGLPASVIPPSWAVKAGAQMTLTATAKTGHVFSHWEGLPAGTVQQGHVAVFAMPAQDVPGLTAVFIANPFTQGAFAALSTKPLFKGLLRPDEETTPGNDTVGVLSATLTASKGSLSGKMWMGGLVVSFTGALHGDGTVWLKADKVMAPALPFAGRELAMSWSETGLAMTVTGPGGEVSEGMARPPLYSKTNPLRGSLLDVKGRQGYFTIALPAMNAEGPQGSGHAALTLLSDGTLKLAGTLAEGTKVTAAGFLASGDESEVYIVLPTPGGTTKQGSLLGTLVFDETHSDSDVSSADMQWFRPAALTKATVAQAYRAGWPEGIPLGLTGALYDKTATVQTTLGIAGPGRLLFQDGKLALPVEVTNFIISGSTVTKAPKTDKSFTLSFTAGTGLMKGTFTPGWTSARLPAFQGVLLGKGANQGGWGFFLSNQTGDLNPESGSVLLVK